MFRPKPRVGAALAAAATLHAFYAYADDPKAGDIGQIVVTATPFAHAADSFASIVGQVSRDEILRSGGANLADVLGEVPGITGSSFASGASRPVIRGFDANRVRILENGVGSFDVSDDGPDHGVPIDPLSAQKVEVVRGAATLRYGSQAIGGVVNAINNRVPLTLPDKDVTGELTGSYGTTANSRQGSGLIDAKAGQFAFHAEALCATPAITARRWGRKPIHSSAAMASPAVDPISSARAGWVPQLCTTTPNTVFRPTIPSSI